MNNREFTGFKVERGMHRTCRMVLPKGVKISFQRCAGKLFEVLVGAAVSAQTFGYQSSLLHTLADMTDSMCR